MSDTPFAPPDDGRPPATPGGPPPAQPAGSPPAQPGGWPPPWPAQQWPQQQWPPQQWGAPYPPYGGWQPVPERTNPWAVVALVTGILPLFPVAIASGIVGIVQAGRRHERGLGLAVAGLVLGTLWLVAAALVGLGVSTGALTDANPPLGPVAHAGSTRVGTCLHRGSPVACDDGHDEEVFEVRTLGAGGWPGSRAVANRADDACYGTFASYVGSSYESSDLEYDYYAPTEGEWLAGEHRVVCVVEPGSSGTLEHSSARDSGR